MSEESLFNAQWHAPHVIDPGAEVTNPLHEKFGAVGDGSANDATALSNADLDSPAPLLLPAGKVFRIASSVEFVHPVIARGQLRPESGATVTLPATFSVVPGCLDTSAGGSFTFSEAPPSIDPSWFYQTTHTGFSAALRSAFDVAVEVNAPVLLRPGEYDLSAWTGYRNSGSLTVVAEKPGTVILAGPGSGSFISPDADLHLFGLTVESFATPVQLDSSEDIEYLHIENCKSESFTRFIYSPSTATGSLKNLIILGNHFTGGLASGIEIQKSDLESVIIASNIIENITRAGYVRGIMLGQNSEMPDAAVRGRYVISNNILRNLISTGEFEVQGILVYGERAIIEGNQLDTVESEATTGCEGIYTKCIYSIVKGNILKDAGQYQSAINIKGARRSEGSEAVAPGYSIICANNMVWFTGKTRPGGTHGITVETDEALVEGNQIHGCIGNPIHVRYPLNSVVRGNIITRCDATVMIRVEPYSTLSIGDTVVIEDNLIADITRDTGAIWGIGVTNNSPGALKNIFIRGNKMRRFTTSGNVWGVVIQTSTDDIENVWIEDNVVPAEAARGINLTGGNEINGVVIQNNDLRCAGDPIASFATLTVDPIIAGNLGVTTKRKLQVTIAAAATQSANVAYGMPSYARAVEASDIMVCPASSLGSATKWWMVPSGSNFRIFVDAAPGSTVTFTAWIDIETPSVL
jgi:hypothetical protein